MSHTPELVFFKTQKSSKALNIIPKHTDDLIELVVYFLELRQECSVL